jgi:acyl-CoA thioesterase
MTKKDPGSGTDDIVRERIAAFDSSEFARMLGIAVTEAREGYARVSMPASGKRNPHDVIHGGAIFTLADHAFAIAANAGSARRVAVSAHIQYFAPASGDLEAVAEFVGGSGKYSVYRVTVCEGRRLVAAFDGTAIQVPP